MLFKSLTDAASQFLGSEATDKALAALEQLNPQEAKQRLEQMLPLLPVSDQIKQAAQQLIAAHDIDPAKIVQAIKLVRQALTK